MILGLLVAAGRGRRFDPSGVRSKLESSLDGVMVAARTAQALLAGCDRVIAAVRPDSTRLAAELTAVGCEIAWVTGEEGMGTSIACAARDAARFKGLNMLLIQPADMPWLQPDSVRQIALAEPQDRQLIVVPTFDGHDGHPVRFDGSLLDELMQLSGDRGARQILLRHPTFRVPVQDAGVLRDIDTPDDLAQAPEGDGPSS
jgi:molybdenum cofactor cytidylyltransferase